MLLERESPLRVLNAALKLAIAGEGRLTLVSGEAGIGKTSLVAQFTREYRKSIRTLWGTCDALFMPRPLGPLLDMVLQLEGELQGLQGSNIDRQAVFSAFLSLESLAVMSSVLGREADAERASQAAIAVLESRPPSAALAQAYKAQCLLRKEHHDVAEAVASGEKAIVLAEHFGNRDTLARALNYMGCAVMIHDVERGRALLERSLAIAREARLPFALGGALANLGQTLVEVYRFAEARRHLDEGIPYAADHDDDYHL